MAIHQPTLIENYPWYGDRPRDPFLEDWEFAIEEWRAIPWADHHYVSNLGRVRRDTHTRIYPKPHGRSRQRTFEDCILRWNYKGSTKLYPSVTINVDGKRFEPMVHLLVAEAFLESKPSGRYEVDHIDGNSFNARVNNLRWVTHAQNIAFRNEREHERGVVRLPMPPQPEGYCSHGHKKVKDGPCVICRELVFQRNKAAVLKFLADVNEVMQTTPAHYNVGEQLELDLGLDIARVDKDVVELFDRVSSNDPLSFDDIDEAA